MGCNLQSYQQDETDVWGWDSDHVRMPCSPHNTIRRNDPTTRWHIIKKSLKDRHFSTSYELEAAIKSYNVAYSHTWNFHALHEFSYQNPDLFRRTIPKIIRLALELPHQITRPIPLLRREAERSVSLSQQQIASILANAFLCTFPWRNDTRNSQEYVNFPTINFSWLFKDAKPSNLEKIKCLFHYFQRVADNPPTGVVTYTRRHIFEQQLPKWRISHRPLTQLQITSGGSIEKDGRGMLQVDFANKKIGGGVLGNGCVQEEIRFVTNPELIAARLIAEELLNNEAILIEGSECYSRHTGYADSFKWAGDFRDETPRDSSGRRRCAIVAIDATHFKDYNVQYNEHALLREINKAYVGFSNTEVNADRLPVATGNWGCGAYKGDPQLKMLLQLMAASESQRSIRYFTFGDSQLEQRAKQILTMLGDQKITVGRLYQLIEEYGRERRNASGSQREDLFTYLSRLGYDLSRSHTSHLSNSTNTNKRRYTQDENPSTSKHYKRY